MHGSRSNPGRALAAAAAAAAAALLAPATAGAAEQADLRVEGGGRPLAQATYLADTARIKTATSCGASGAVKTAQGPTALGLLSSASATSSRLRPLAVSDEFEFGLFVCGVGSFTGTGASSYWLYKVDHEEAPDSVDKHALKGGEDVLFYFVDNDAGVNTGSELWLQAPARAEPDGTVTVRVWAYDTAGRRTPAAGALVQGEDEATTDGQGRATLETPARGTLRIRAERGPDVPSQTLSVCITAKPRCASRRGKRIFGTRGGDRIAGSKGPDTVYAGAGKDRVSVRGGGRDTVHCGSARDSVRADDGDKVARDCEVVRRA
jgi:Ca2+-binding RTX toxin-like protein